MAQATWGGPLASGTGLVRTGSGAAGELAVTWTSRTERANGKELAAAAHSACYALALRLGEHKAVLERLAITATVTLDEAAGPGRRDRDGGGAGPPPVPRAGKGLGRWHERPEGA